MLFEDRGGKGFAIWTAESSLGGKVKEKWVVVVELIERTTFFRCDETKSVGRGREGEREREGGGGREGERERERDR